MQTSIEEGKEAQHATKANQLWKAKEFPERRNTKSNDQKTQRPISGGVSDELDGIGGQIVVERAPTQQTQGHQTEQKNYKLAPLAV